MSFQKHKKNILQAQTFERYLSDVNTSQIILRAFKNPEMGFYFYNLIFPVSSFWWHHSGQLLVKGLKLSKYHSPNLALLRQITIAAQDSRQHSQSGVARFTLVVLHAEQPSDHQFQTLNLRHTRDREASNMLYSSVSSLSASLGVIFYYAKEKKRRKEPVYSYL